MPDAAYRATLDRLFRRRRFGARPGLEVIEALLEALGHPERRFPAVHVAGSKGKGSVSAIAASVLSAAGLRTGLYTSPHLQSYRERMQVDRVPIAPGAVVEGVARIEAISDELERAGRLPHPPTFFEMTTALAFDWFARERVDAAVVEVGVGGLLDATNVLHAAVGAITTIELEHEEILGPTLTAIAFQKAGIVHPGMRLVVSEPKPEPLREIERVAHAAGVPVWHLDREVRYEGRTLGEGVQRLAVETPRRRVDRLALPLLGTFQARNVAVAVAAADLLLESLGRTATDAQVRRGVRSVEWRGRLERVARRPDLYLDIAHTPESARALAASLAEIVPFADPAENVLLFGCLRGKKAEEILEALSPLAGTIVLTPIRSDRSLDLESLRRAARGRFPRVVASPSAEAALRLARAATGKDGFTLAAGSDYLIGELLNVLAGRASDEPDLSDPSLRGPGQEAPVP